MPSTPGTPITVGYVDASGNRKVRTLSRLELAPYLEAWCHHEKTSA
ncbi:hypothetical protein AB0G53_08470 [Streptomyces sp. NPDC021722]